MLKLSFFAVLTFFFGSEKKRIRLFNPFWAILAYITMKQNKHIKTFFVGFRGASTTAVKHMF